MGERKKIVIGNWKSNKTEKEMASFFNEFAQYLQKAPIDLFNKIQAVICPAFVHLAQARYFIQSLKLQLSLGAQDISPFMAGSFTGEVYSLQLKDYVDYCLVGHSERRKYFKETDELLAQKVKNAKTAQLTIIYCVPDSETTIPESADIAAYEPVFAIGTGKPDTADNAARVTREIKMKNPQLQVLYGGSVTEENIKDYLNQKDISGVLPGKSSLDAGHFYRMLLNAAE